MRLRIMALEFRLKFNLISLNHSLPQKEWVREQGLDSIPVIKSLSGMGEIFASWLDPVILVSRFAFLVNAKEI